LPHDHRRGVLWALASTFGIAGFVVPWKIAASHGGTATNTLVLLTAAAVFNSLLTIYQQKSLPSFRRFDLGVASALAVFTLFGNLTSAFAIALVSPALLTVVQRAEVIIVALLAWPIIGERIDRRFFLGASLAGCGLLLLQDPFSGPTPRAEGMYWAVASALCFGTMAVLTRKFIHQIDIVSVNALRLWLAVGFWFALNGFPEELRTISAPQIGYASLAAFFGPFLGRLCLMNAARFLEARTTTLATLAAPPLTLVISFIVLSDLPTSREILGGAIMLIGIAVPFLSRKQPPAKGTSNTP
jgi:drug/metabolite transporter (DMT)-like permease